MRFTCHRLGGQFVFVPRPGVNVLGYAGSCFQAECDGGLGLIIANINPHQTIVTLESWPESPGEVCWVYHPNCATETAWEEVRHNLQPLPKPGSPTHYSVLGDLALLGQDGELYIHDTGQPDDPGHTNQYLAQHPPYTDRSLYLKAVDSCIYAAFEMGLAIPGDDFSRWVGIFASGLVFAEYFPNVAKAAVTEEERRTHGVWGKDNPKAMLYKAMEALDAYVSEHPGEAKPDATENLDLPPELREMMRGLDLDPDNPPA